MKKIAILYYKFNKMIDESPKEIIPTNHPESKDEESFGVIPSSVKINKRKCCPCLERLTSIKELFLQTYRRPKHPEEFKIVQEFIHKKTWLIHSMIIALRCILSMVGSDLHQKIFENNNKSSTSLNQEYLITSKLYMEPILIAFLPLGAIIDIAAWRYPQLIRVLPYFEIVHLVALFCCPLDLGNLMAELICFLIVMLAYILFANFDSVGNICFTLIILLQFFVRHKLVLTEELTAVNIVVTFLYAGAGFLSFSTISMMTSYIVNIHGKLAEMVKVETLNLFNGLDEGVVVFSAVDKSLTFASAPAV